MEVTLAVLASLELVKDAVLEGAEALGAPGGYVFGLDECEIPKHFHQTFFSVWPAFVLTQNTGCATVRRWS